MRKLLLFLVLFCTHHFVNSQSVDVTSDCLGGTYSFTFDYFDTGTGRNVYFNETPFSAEIKFNSSLDRWEMKVRGATESLYFINSYASTPNPPSSTASGWTAVDDCSGFPTSTFSGTGTQDDLGGDPCADLGGDTDGDGVCDDGDICPGFDDNADQDNDNIPDGCDDNPTIPDGVLVDAPCLDPLDAIIYLPDGQTADGRNRYSNNPTGTEISYHFSLGRWEIKAQDPGTDVYFYNEFASYPDPPATGAGTWTGLVECPGQNPDDVSGSGTQTDLGCTININLGSVTQPECNGDGVIEVSASDNIGDVTYYISGPESTSNSTGIFTNLPDGDYTLTAEDGIFPVGVCVSTTTQSIASSDDILPTITCPANIVVNNDPGECGAMVTYTAPVGEDNCPGAVTTLNSGQASGSFFSVGTHVIEYLVTDGSGLTATCSFTITVVDNEAPAINCGPEIIVNNTPGSCGTVVNYPIPSGTDNCPGSTVSLVSGLGSGAFFSVGTSEEIYQITDAVGKTAVCTLRVTVVDADLPSISCLSDINVSNDAGECGAIVTYTPPVGVDNCPGATTALKTGLGSGAFFPVGTTIETYQVTDAAGNSATCSFTITVSDTESPSITCPGNIEVNNDPGQCGAVVNYDLPTYGDNCGVTGLVSNGWDPGDFFPVGITTVNYIASDAAGNKKNCSFTVTVKDNEGPTLECVGSITLELGPDGTVPLIPAGETQQATYLINLLFTTFEDNCGVNGGQVNYTAPRVFTCDNIGTKTHTFFAFDIYGNQSSCDVDIIITDPLDACCEAPQITTCAPDVDVECGSSTDPSATGKPIYSDDCGLGSLSFSDVFSPGCGNTGIITRTWTITDINGDSDQCVQTINIVDTTPPTVSAPQQFTINLNENCEQTIVDLTAAFFIEDNCSSIGNLTIVQSPAPGTIISESQLLTLTVTDECGLSTTVTVPMIVVDPIAPVIICPADVTQSADANCKSTIPDLTSSATATDNCPGATVSQSPPAGTVIGLGATPVTLTATDAFGNSRSCDMNVIVIDDTAPTTICQDISVTLDLNGEASIVAGDIDGGSFDNCSEVSISASPVNFTTADIGNNTVTLEVSDVYTNANTCTATVTVQKRAAVLTNLGVFTGQYSDPVTLSAQLLDALTGDPIVGETIVFNLGAQNNSGVTNAVGIATVSITLDQAPGSYDLVSTFSGNDIHQSASDIDPFTISQENALTFYTGSTFVSTGSSNSGEATVFLTATIEDINDSNRGEIINADVYFVDRDGGDINSTPLTVSLISSTLGTVSYAWDVNIGNSDSESFEVGIRVDNYYIANNPADDVVITVSKALGDKFITGGGYLVLCCSEGQLDGESGTKNNFGFNIKYNKKGTNLQGNIRSLFRRYESDGVLHTYQIKGNKMESLSVNDNYAEFTGKANVQDVTDPDNPISVLGNGEFIVKMTDHGEPGTDDNISLSLYDKDGPLIFTSNWDGTVPQLQNLDGGNLQVQNRGGGNNAVKARNDYLDDNVIDVSVYPNPAANFLFLRSDGEKLENVHLWFIDLKGRTIISQQNVNLDRGGVIKLSIPDGITNGLYHIVLKKGSTEKSIPIVLL